MAEYCNLEASDAARLLHEAREALKTGRVNFPDSELSFELLSEEVNAVINIEHDLHELLVEYQNVGVRPT